MRLSEQPPALAVADVTRVHGDSVEDHLDEAQASKLAACYRDRHYVIVDDAVPQTLVEAAHAECQRHEATFEQASVYSSATNVSVPIPDRRSDRIHWLDLAADASAEEGPAWAAVTEAVAVMDSIIRGLRERLHDELGHVASRQRPMLSAYSEGARFERHCDNHCDHDDLGGTGGAADVRGEEAYPVSDALAAEKERQPSPAQPGRRKCANRRRLSAILYLTPEWKASDGGALRIFKPASDLADPEYDGDDALVDVVPMAGRLVLFASDQRCPHEVLPVAAPDRTRYAVALWYSDTTEFTTTSEYSDA